MAADILIVAVNARYSHCSHAGRTLLANLGALKTRAHLLENDLDAHPLQIAAQILAGAPRIAAFSVYLWNTRLIRDILEIIRRAAPGIKVILGGPEIVRGCTASWSGLADALVSGEGETAFRDWCDERLLAEADEARPDLPVWIETPAGENLDSLELPGPHYTDHDLRHRTAYVESSRGCPHHCLYCTSRGTPLRRFPLPRLFDDWRTLLARGLRQFRFLDRTFNADEDHACDVLDFFLNHRPADGLQLHLELSPVRYGQALRERLTAFPAHALHLEVGVQTLNPAVARRIGRAEARPTVIEALTFLARDTRADLHADLIFGLPGEDAASFANGFDRLVRLGIREIQVNRLKGLPGTPILDLPELADAFSPFPPYDVLRTDVLSFDALMRLQRFAQVWERLHNRHRFPHAVPLLWADAGASPAAAIDAIAETVFRTEGRVHALGHRDWARALSCHLLNHLPAAREAILEALRRDGVPCDLTD